MLCDVCARQIAAASFVGQVVDVVPSFPKASCLH